MIQWAAIGIALGRVPSDCCDKWHKTMASKAWICGLFTEEEDLMILHSVREWEEKFGHKPGVWTQLQKELGRRSKAISQRWKVLMEKQK